MYEYRDYFKPNPVCFRVLNESEIKFIESKLHIESFPEYPIIFRNEEKHKLNAETFRTNQIIDSVKSIPKFDYKQIKEIEERFNESNRLWNEQKK